MFKDLVCYEMTGRMFPSGLGKLLGCTGLVLGCQDVLVLLEVASDGWFVLVLSDDLFVVLSTCSVGIVFELNLVLLFQGL